MSYVRPYVRTMHCIQFHCSQLCFSFLFLGSCTWTMDIHHHLVIVMFPSLSTQFFSLQPMMVLLLRLHISIRFDESRAHWPMSLDDGALIVCVLCVLWTRAYVCKYKLCEWLTAIEVSKLIYYYTIYLRLKFIMPMYAIRYWFDVMWLLVAASQHICLASSSSLDEYAIRGRW